MKNYIGVKHIKAKPMTRLEYNIYRNWDLPKDEKGDDKGYLVEYTNGSEGNHPNHKGYISWSPKKVFDDAYQDINNTLGAERTVYTHNPDGLNSVGEIKSLGSYLINKIEKLRNKNNNREIDIAETEIETGLMYAVKSIFK